MEEASNADQEVGGTAGGSERNVSEQAATSQAEVAGEGGTDEGAAPAFELESTILNEMKKDNHNVPKKQSAKLMPLFTSKENCSQKKPLIVDGRDTVPYRVKNELADSGLLDGELGVN